jgi:hypothetical protein
MSIEESKQLIRRFYTEVVTVETTQTWTASLPPITWITTLQKVAVGPK